MSTRLSFHIPTSIHTHLRVESIRSRGTQEIPFYKDVYKNRKLDSKYLLQNSKREMKREKKRRTEI